MGKITFNCHFISGLPRAENEFDLQLGVKGLHLVKRKVEHKVRRSILPPDLFAKYQDMDFWLDSTGTAAHSINTKKTQQEHQSGQTGAGRDHE